MKQVGTQARKARNLATSDYTRLFFQSLHSTSYLMLFYNPTPTPSPPHFIRNLFQPIALTSQGADSWLVKLFEMNNFFLIISPTR